MIMLDFTQCFPKCLVYITSVNPQRVHIKQSSSLSPYLKKENKVVRLSCLKLLRDLVQLRFDQVCLVEDRQYLYFLSEKDQQYLTDQRIYYGKSFVGFSPFHETVVLEMVLVAPWSSTCRTWSSLLPQLNPGISGLNKWQVMEETTILRPKKPASQNRQWGQMDQQLDSEIRQLHWKAELLKLTFLSLLNIAEFAGIVAQLEHRGPTDYYNKQ